MEWNSDLRFSLSARPPTPVLGPLLSTPKSRGRKPRTCHGLHSQAHPGFTAAILWGLIPPSQLSSEMGLLSVTLNSLLASAAHPSHAALLGKELTQVIATIRVAWACCTAGVESGPNWYRGANVQRGHAGPATCPCCSYCSVVTTISSPTHSLRVHGPPIFRQPALQTVLSNKMWWGLKYF